MAEEDPEIGGSVPRGQHQAVPMPIVPVAAKSADEPGLDPGDDEAVPTQVAATAHVVSSVDLLHPSLISSRASLCQVLDVLAEHRAALTIVGAHAVHERTHELAIESTSTKDGDLAVTPTLVTDEPTIEAAMREAGFQPLMEIANNLPSEHPGRRWTGRPGLWGTAITADGTPIDEVDLMVPEAIAGSGRRSVGSLKEHGKDATGRVTGLELCVLERDELEIQNFADGSTRVAYVARHSGLICAKAHKIVDRQKSMSSGRDRRGLTIPKDTVDMWRCMATSDPETVRAEFERHVDDVESGPAITEGLGRFRGLLADGQTAAIVIANLAGDGVPESDVLEVFQAWRTAFACVPG